MAYADGELDGAEHAADRARIEAAMRADPEVVRRIESHRALRRQLGATFDRVLDEPVPDRLIAAVRRASARADGDSGTPAATDAADARATGVGATREERGTGAQAPTRDSAGRGEPRLEGSRSRPADETHAAERANTSGETRTTYEGRGAPSAARAPGASIGDNPAEPSTRSAISVTDLSAARAAKAEAAERSAKSRTSWGLPQWAALAASLILGAIIGHLALKSPELSPIASKNGHLVAQGNLADALSNQLASTQSTTAPVQIGTTFKAKSGTYCRTFVLHEGEGDSLGGLACRADNEWNVNTLARADTSPGDDGGYRPAGSEMPAAVLNAVEGQIVGDPLDSSAEAHAKGSGWK
jgi:hypothetical protein